jgi:hypothetical protein
MNLMSRAISEIVIPDSEVEHSDSDKTSNVSFVGVHSFVWIVVQLFAGLAVQSFLEFAVHSLMKAAVSSSVQWVVQPVQPMNEWPAWCVFYPLVGARSAPVQQQPVGRTQHPILDHNSTLRHFVEHESQSLIMISIGISLEGLTIPFLAENPTLNSLDLPLSERTSIPK